MSVTGQSLARLKELTDRLTSAEERYEARGLLEQLEERINLANAENRTLRNLLNELVKPDATPNLKTLYVRGLVNPGAHDERIDFVLAKREDVLPYFEGMREIPKPIPMRLPCEACGKLHIDVGEFATKPHHTHTCQHCGLNWRPAKEHTVGVRWIPGFKNAEDPEAIPSADKLRAAGWGRIAVDLGSTGPEGARSPVLKAIHIGSKWRHATDAVNDYTVTHIDRLVQCASDGPSWEGSESEFRKQFLWVSDP